MSDTHAMASVSPEVNRETAGMRLVAPASRAAPAS